MELKRRLSLVVAIMSVAFGSGHLVQNVFVKPPMLASAAPALQPVGITLVASGPEIPQARLKVAEVVPFSDSFAAAGTSATPKLFAIQDAADAPADVVKMPPTVAAIADACPISLDLAVEPSALISLTLRAPCHVNERIVLNHAGISVTAKTSGIGIAVASLPAMTADATVSARFADGKTVSANLAVPEASDLRRFGVQWMGEEAFQLNAFENGADYGEIGHVSAADPQRPLAGNAQIGGFLSVLGDDQVDRPMLAEVYTYPKDAGAVVKIVVEAAITKSTCARDILGETLAEVGGNVTITDLTVTMPECSAIGDILVLKNVDPDLKIAFAN